MLMNKALLMASGKKGSIRYFEFVASKAGSDVDFFSGGAPASWTVSINGAPTSQSASALTFSSGDTVRIEYDETPAATFIAAGRNYLKTIDGAIPVVESTDFWYCFANCYDLTSIPEGLFANNPNVTNFSDCFMECSRLTPIPAGLFANNPNVTNFSNCFAYCSALTVRVRISSAKVSQATYFAGDTKAKGTVYVPSGSKTASTFKSTTNANVTVVEE